MNIFLLCALCSVGADAVSARQAAYLSNLQPAIVTIEGEKIPFAFVPENEEFDIRIEDGRTFFVDDKESIHEHVTKKAHVHVVSHGGKNYLLNEEQWNWYADIDRPSFLPLVSKSELPFVKSFTFVSVVITFFWCLFHNRESIFWKIVIPFMIVVFSLIRYITDEVSIGVPVYTGLSVVIGLLAAVAIASGIPQEEEVAKNLPRIDTDDSI